MYVHRGKRRIDGRIARREREREKDVGGIIDHGTDDDDGLTETPVTEREKGPRGWGKRKTLLDNKTLRDDAARAVDNVNKLTGFLFRPRC